MPSSDSAYVAALKLLGGRELSERQVRERLARRGYDMAAIDAAIERLKTTGSIDDERAARALAHSETSVRKRGRLRVKRRLDAAGIPSSVADRAMQETFRAIDVDALMVAALNKRLRGRDSIADDREFQRLYRYLLGQGFEPDRVVALLRRRRQEHSD